MELASNEGLGEDLLDDRATWPLPTRAPGLVDGAGGAGAAVRPGVIGLCIVSGFGIKGPRPVPSSRARPSLPQGSPASFQCYPSASEVLPRNFVAPPCERWFRGARVGFNDAHSTFIAHTHRRTRDPRASLFVPRPRSQIRNRGRRCSFSGDEASKSEIRRRTCFSSDASTSAVRVPSGKTTRTRQPQSPSTARTPRRFINIGSTIVITKKSSSSSRPTRPSSGRLGRTPPSVRFSSSSTPSPPSRALPRRRRSKVIIRSR